MGAAALPAAGAAEEHRRITAPVQQQQALLPARDALLDGLLQRLRQRSNMPVVFLTSKDEEVDELMGLRLGADDYITKPFSQRLLLERIRALLRRNEASRAEGSGAPPGGVGTAPMSTRRTTGSAPPPTRCVSRRRR